MGTLKFIYIFLYCIVDPKITELYFSKDSERVSFVCFSPYRMTKLTILCSPLTSSMHSLRKYARAQILRNSSKRCRSKTKKKHKHACGGLCNFHCRVKYVPRSVMHCSGAIAWSLLFPFKVLVCIDACDVQV